jgi:ribonuclease HI
MIYSITIHADGACSGNPGPGGWAAKISFEGNIDVLLSGGDPNTTNNAMELQAAIAAFDYIVTNRVVPANIVLRLDSQYVLNGLKDWSRAWAAGGWRTAKNTPVKNCSHWQQLVSLRDQILNQGGSVDYQHVKGHSGDPHNDEVDRLAVEARDISALVSETWVEEPVIVS